MGTVTVVNKANYPIDSSISAGLNYDWANNIPRGQYVKLDGVASVVTLHVKYWTGEQFGYESNLKDFGLFMAGTVITGLLVIAAVATLGAGLICVPVAAAGAAGAGVAAGLGAGGAAVAVSGGLVTMVIGAIAITMKDFAKTATDKPHIQAIDN